MTYNANAGRWIFLLTVLLASLSGILCTSCQAALQWDALQLTANGWQGDESIVSTFHFRNVGSSPVKLLSVKSSCGCTTVRWPENAVAPGEVADIRATYDVGTNVGAATKLITVVSDDAPSKPTILILNLIVRPLAEIHPSLVSWKVGDPCTPRLVTLKFASVKKASAIEAASVSPLITTHIDKTADGLIYTLTLLPKTTEEALQSPILCTATIDNKSLSLSKIFALVK
jgi:Protein of unknown function (DUF1573)